MSSISIYLNDGIWQELMGRYRQLSPDGSECGCLKAIAVFKPGKRTNNLSILAAGSFKSSEEEEIFFQKSPAHVVRIKAHDIFFPRKV